MTVLGWIGLSLYLLIGFGVGVLIAVDEKRNQLEEAPVGGSIFIGIVFLPVIAVGLAFAGMLFLLDRLIDKVDTKLPLTKKQLQNRIAELERELELDR